MTSQAKYNQYVAMRAERTDSLNHSIYTDNDDLESVQDRREGKRTIHLFLFT